MKTKFLLALLFPLHLALAQSTAVPGYMQQHQMFGLQLGFNRLRLLDRNNSSLVYRGNIPTLGLHYEGLKNGNRFLTQFQIGRGSFYSEAYPDRAIKFSTEDVYGHVDSVAVPMRANTTLGRISLGYLRRIESPGPLDYEVGAIVADELYYPQGFTQPGLMNIATFSPTVQMDYTPAERHYFTIRISVPLVSLVSRSTYNNSVSQPVDGKLVGFLDQGTRWESVDKHRQIDISAAWLFRMGDHWMSGLHYKLRVLKNTTPRDLTMLQNELGLSVQVFH